MKYKKCEKEIKSDNKKNKLILIFCLIAIPLIILIYVINNNGGFSTKVDYSEYLFTKYEWEGEDGELYFGEDGTFYYNEDDEPVADYDLCDSYRYDEKSKTIKLNCSFEFIHPRKMKIIEMNEKFIKLKFGLKTETFRQMVDYNYDFIGEWHLKTENGEEILNFLELGTLYYYKDIRVDATVFDPEEILNLTYSEEYEDTGYNHLLEEEIKNNEYDKNVCNGNPYTDYVVYYREKFYEVSCLLDNWNRSYYEYFYNEDTKTIDTYAGITSDKENEIIIKYVDDKTLKVNIDGVTKEFFREA